MSSQYSQNTLIYLKGHGIIPTQQSAINSKAQSLQLLNSTNFKANWNPSSNILIHLSNNRYYYGLLLNMTEATCKTCIYIFENGAFYKGSIKNGKFQGKGQLIRYSSDFNEKMSFYKGDWINGKPHGFGKQFILNSMIYQGFFRQGKKHGKGKLVYKDESYYDGQFKDNKIQGYGVYKTAIHQWTGFWKEGYLEGQGEQITFGDNQQYQGKVSESTYHGMFERGQKQGKGVYKWGHDFSEYSGTFEKGQLNGQGRFKLGTCEYIGQWKKGVEIQLNSLSVIKLKKIQKKETLSSLVIDIDDINKK